MKFRVTILVWLFAFGAFAAEVQVYFSPDGGCTSAITNQLAQAKQTIFIQAYSFSSAPIAQAVVAAQRRGVKVMVLLDKSQRTAVYSSADFMYNAGVTVFIDASHAIAHNKVMVIDGRTVVTGSFNFSKAAEQNNAENLLVIHDPALATKYLANWQAHLEHSLSYEGRK